jgi:hypothetical protein
MKKGLFWIVLSCLMVLSMILASCTASSVTTGNHNYFNFPDHHSDNHFHNSDYNFPNFLHNICRYNHLGNYNLNWELVG